MIRAIVNADAKWGIGKNNSLLFHLPADMKFFRETTSGKTIVMGGNTLRSFPGGKPLKNRINIVLSRSQVRDDCIVVRTLDGLFAELKKRPDEEIYVIGGGDTFFPDLDKDPAFALKKEGERVEDNGYFIRFVTYENLAVRPL